MKNHPSVRFRVYITHYGKNTRIPIKNISREGEKREIRKIKKKESEPGTQTKGKGQGGQPNPV